MSNEIVEQIRKWIVEGKINFDDMQELSCKAYAREQQLDAETDSE